MHRWCFYLLCFLTSFLQGSVAFHPLEPQLINRLPIDPHTGRITYTTMDSFWAGPEEIEIRRTYRSPQGFWIGRWWIMNHLKALKRLDVGEGAYSMTHPTSGTQVIAYEGKRGYKRPAAGELEAHNYFCKREGQWLTIEFEKGRQFIFQQEQKKDRKHFFHLMREKTAKGNILLYSYDKKWRLIQIQVVSSDQKHLFSTVRFHYVGKKKEDPTVAIDVDGRHQVFYQYEKIADDYLLTSVKDRFGLIDRYFYRVWREKESLCVRAFLYKIEESQGSFTGFSIPKGGNRVEAIWGYGSDGKPKPLVQLKYHDNGSDCYFSNGHIESYRYNEKDDLITARWGNVEQSMSYDDQGCLIKRITRGYGQTLERCLTYNQEKFLINDRLKMGLDQIVTSYLYDDQGRKKRASHSSGLVEEWRYWGSTGLIKEHYKGDLYRKVTYGEDGCIIYEEEGDQNMVRKVRAYKREHHRIIREKEGYINRDTGEFVCDQIHAYIYDDVGNVTEKSRFDRSGNLVQRESFSYNRRGLVEKKQSSMGQTVEMSYTPTMHLEKEVNGDLETRYTYDRKGRVIKQTRCAPQHEERETCYQYDDFGHLLYQKRESGEKVAYTYDELERRISDETGEWKFDLISNRSCFCDRKGRKTTYLTGLYREPYRTIHPDGSEERCEVELFGQKKVFFDEGGIATVCRYDELGRLVCKERASRRWEFTYIGEKLTEIAENGEKVAQFAYDGAGRITYEKNLAQVRKYFYDYIGFLTSVEEDGQMILFTRDAMGRVVEKWVGRDVTTYKYDDKGEVVRYGRGAFEERTQWEIINDAFGDQKWESGPRGEITEWQRTPRQMIKVDSLGRKEISLLDKRGQTVKKVLEGRDVEETFTYDAIGNLITYARKSGGEERTLHYKYDARDRVIEMKDHYGARYRKYDAQGKMVEEKRENGACIYSEYNVHGELVHVHSDDGTINYRYHYNDWGGVTKTENLVTGRICQRMYDENRRLIREELENGLVMEYGYVGTKKKFVRLPDASSIHYVYDHGQIARIYRCNRMGEVMYDHLVDLDSRGLVKSEQMIKGLGRIEHRYDRDLRPKKIASPFHYQLIADRDGVGNVLKVVDPIRSLDYTVDALDQIVIRPSAPNGFFELAAPPERDSGGRVVRRGKSCFRYDALDRLIAIEQEGETEEITRDAFHRVVLRKQSNAEGYSNQERYIYDGMWEIGMADEKGAIKQLRVMGYGDQGERGWSVAVELNEKVYAPLHDLCGSMTGLVDPASRQVVSRSEYSIYGEVLFCEGIRPPWGFHAKRSAALGGVLFYGLRTYLPECGEFCQLDERAGGNECNLIHFNYNNPLRFSDPWGLDSKEAKGNPEAIHLENKASKPRVPYCKWLNDFSEEMVKMRIANSEHIKEYPAREGATVEPILIVINGIYNHQDDCQKLANLIMSRFKGHMVSINNLSQGKVVDVLRAISEYFNEETGAIQNLRSTLLELHETMGKEVFLLAHSEGAIIAKRALETIDDAIKDNLNVRTFGPAAAIPNCYAKSVVNYFSSKDMMQFISGLDRARGFCYGHKFTNVYLSSSDTKLGEHSIHSPSYQFALDQVFNEINSRQFITQ